MAVVPEQVCEGVPFEQLHDHPHHPVRLAAQIVDENNIMMAYLVTRERLAQAARELARVRHVPRVHHFEGKAGSGESVPDSIDLPRGARAEEALDDVLVKVIVGLEAASFAGIVVHARMTSRRTGTDAALGLVRPRAQGPAVQFRDALIIHGAQTPRTAGLWALQSPGGPGPGLRCTLSDGQATTQFWDPEQLGRTRVRGRQPGARRDRRCCLPDRPLPRPRGHGRGVRGRADGRRRPVRAEVPPAPARAQSQDDRAHPTRGLDAARSSPPQCGAGACGGGARGRLDLDDHGTFWRATRSRR